MSMINGCLIDEVSFHKENIHFRLNISLTFQKQCHDLYSPIRWIIFEQICIKNEHFKLVLMT